MSVLFTFVVRGVKFGAKDVRVMLNICMFGAKSALRMPYCFVSLSVIQFTLVPSEGVIS